MFFVRNAKRLAVLFNPSHKVAFYNMNRQVGILPKYYWSRWMIKNRFLPLTKKYEPQTALKILSSSKVAHKYLTCRYLCAIIKKLNASLLFLPSRPHRSPHLFPGRHVSRSRRLRSKRQIPTSLPWAWHKRRLRWHQP